ncbi:MAG: polysaccharide biosynthesis C-terminal domain-containing protein [Flavobacteriales bacterium]|nr:polysaccharide biosynthesis C-terminal domain-containing protein [Flavobacteriales bacterium]
MLLYTLVFLLCTLALVLDLKRTGNFQLGWKERWLPKRLRRSMASYTVFTFSASVAGIILGNMDQMMIGALLGDKALIYVAQYAVAFYFGSVIAAPGRALQQVAAPLLADAWKRDDRAMVSELYKRSAFVQWLASALLFSLMATGLGDFFQLLPSTYAGAAQVAVIIGAAYLLSGSLGLSWSIISMSRSYWLDAISSLTMVALNFTLNYVLILRMGLQGAAWATFISLTAVNIVRTWFLWHKYRLWPFDARFLMVLGIMLAIIYVMPWVPLTGTPLIDLALRAVLVCVLFGLPAYALGLLKEVEAMVVKVRR